MSISSGADLEVAERYCAALARREAANFYWGFIALPKEQRTAIYALYDFARQVDDAADESPPAEALPALARQRERLRLCLAGIREDPVMQVLGPAVERYRIPAQELEAVIDGVQRDLNKVRYADWPELRAYCESVASAVGRMCVRIWGFSEPAALDRARDLGMAMQLTNILRDVREDAGLGRIYLPQKELRQFGVAEACLLEGSPGAAWPALVRFEVRRARDLFDSGLRVIAYIPFQSGVCVRTLAGIYTRILGIIEDDPWLPLERRVSLSSRAKARVLLRSWLPVG
jgi:phytoene synthase